MSTTMLIATHKAAAMPSESMYVPVHVGRTLTEQDFGYQSDADGENISAKNRSYCELTALYWAWKNTDADAYGLSHYRRYFSGEAAGPNGIGVMSDEEASAALEQYEVIVGKRRNYVVETIDSHYRNGHHGEDLDVLRASIERLSPEYIPSYEAIFSGRKLSLYNMFLMRGPIFRQYAEWLFTVLADVESKIDESDRSAYQQRTMGYLGERLLNVWVHAHPELTVDRRKIVNTDGEPKVKKAIGLIKRKVTGRSQ